MRTIELAYAPELRDRFFNGELLEVWKRRYPKAFDDRDVALARPRLKWGRLFNEWFTAAQYAQQGYSVLIGKYQFSKAHPKKAHQFREIAPLPLVDLLIDSPQFGRCQGPDLFVFGTTPGEWFFVETKSRTERLRPRQMALFHEVERRSGGREIVLLRVTPRPLVAVTSRSKQP